MLPVSLKTIPTVTAVHSNSVASRRHVRNMEARRSSTTVKVAFGRRVDLPSSSASSPKATPAPAGLASSDRRQPCLTNPRPFPKTSPVPAVADVDCSSIDSRENDFDSVSSAVFRQPYTEYGCGDNTSSASLPRRQSVKRSEVKHDPKKSTTRKPTNGRGDAFEHLWKVSDNAFKSAPPKQTKVQKTQQIFDIYTKCSNTTTVRPKASTSTSGNLKSTSFINRQAKLKETERINNILLKKILTVKSTLPNV